jgi:lipocalin
VTPFDLETYISKPWYSQMQQPLLYNNVDTMKCVRADYRRQDNLSSGFEIEVYNQAVNVNTGEKKGCCGGAGTYAGSESLRLCALQRDGGKLGVAPCNLTPDMAGPYWVVHYEEGDDGFVIVAGGDPYLPTLDQGREGGGFSCGYLFLLQNNAGLWFMSRKPIATDATKEKAKDIILKMGLAYSQMMPVDQTGCEYRTPEDR